MIFNIYCAYVEWVWHFFGFRVFAESVIYGFLSMLRTQQLVSHTWRLPAVIVYACLTMCVACDLLRFMSLYVFLYLSLCMCLYLSVRLCRYSFAVVGINITSVACNLLRSGDLRTHFFNAVQAAPQLTDFHDVYGMSQIYERCSVSSRTTCLIQRQ